MVPSLAPYVTATLTASESIAIDIGDGDHVSGLLLVPPKAHACYVLAHGAGAGMAHPFMAAMASGLADRDIATLRYQFPYMERAGKRPDSPAVAQRVVRAAAAHASRALPNLLLVAGGKSFGGRMTSQAQAESPLPGVSGIAFLGFPLHAAGQPSSSRADHLSPIRIPMLFLQGTRDQLAHPHLITAIAHKLGARATLQFFEEADHSFHVPAKSGRSDGEIRTEMVDVLARWIESLGS